MDGPPSHVATDFFCARSRTCGLGTEASPWSCRHFGRWEQRPKHWSRRAAGIDRAAGDRVGCCGRFPSVGSISTVLDGASERARHRARDANRQSPGRHDPRRGAAAARRSESADGTLHCFGAPPVGKALPGADGIRLAPVAPKVPTPIARLGFGDSW